MNSWDNFTKNAIGLLVVLNFCGVVWFSSVFGLKGDATSLPLNFGLISSLGTLAGIVIGYWYGSSESSKRANKTLADQADKLATTVAAQPATGGATTLVAETVNADVGTLNAERK